MSVYTKTGDHGETSLFTGERVKKYSQRVKVYGFLDEFDAALGLARATCINKLVKKEILELQKLLHLLMADLASLSAQPRITLEHVEVLEHKMDELEAGMEPLKEFLIPGDTQGGAALDLARAIARRSERAFLHLAEIEVTHESNQLFLNRVSDFIFLLERLEDKK